MVDDTAWVCPKRMTYGPCGGVGVDSSCEMEVGRRCTFVDVGTVAWQGLVPADRGHGQLLDLIRQRPVVVTDLTLPPFDRATVTRLTAVLRSSCDALLVGEHHNRPDFPPTVMASLIRAGGGTPWLTLTCRDRNRLVLEQDLVDCERIDENVRVAFER